MGFVDERNVMGQCWWLFGSFTRRKQVDSLLTNSVNQQHRHHLAKDLSVLHLIAIGVGATIGAGVYILVGTVAREHSGPALAISFLIAGLAAALSAFCYAELASRCPSAGSAYHYSYICVGEGVAWIVGWALILEYMVGGAAVARGISPNLSLIFGGSDSLPSFLSRHYIPFLAAVIDPCAAFLVFIVTGLLCIGIKESAFVQAVVTTVNICALIFVIVAGSYLCFKSGWVGYELPAGYFPYGVNGMLTGSATVFFAYIGFDSVASTAEEVRHPQRDLPLGIGIALLICCTLYMLVSIVTVGLVPYYAMDPDTPISSAFSSQGMHWASYIVTAGAITALCSTLMGSLLPQPRILMAMARDGLLPPFFSDINRKSQVPVKSTIVTGAAASILAFLMDVSELAGMVSVGTLTAFTMVAVSVLIVRYIPPTVVPLPSSLQKSIDSVTLLYSSLSQDVGVGDLSKSYSIVAGETSDTRPFVGKKCSKISFVLKEETRRKVAGSAIVMACLGILLMAYGASDFDLPGQLRLLICGVGTLIIICGLLVLTIIDQDDARHSFGHSGGFICPFVPLLPVVSILVNVYLLINLGGETWARVSMWMVVGFIVYGVYGWRHSSLLDAVYVPAAHVDEIYQTLADSQPKT